MLSVSYVKANSTGFIRAYISLHASSPKLFYGLGKKLVLLGIHSKTRLAI